ncbi:MAG: hypothetical protein QXR64_03245 [Pyrobaculum sp.]
MSRSTLPVDGEVAREVSNLAKSQGFSVVRLTSDALKLTIELLKKGITPTRALEIFRLVEKVVALDAVPVPLSYLELAAKKWGICNDVEIENFLRETGEKFGKVIADEFKTFGEFMATVTQLLSMFPVARVMYSKSGDVWRIAFTSVGSHSLRCLGIFAESAIRQYGCEVKTTYEENVITAEIVC